MLETEQRNPYTTHIGEMQTIDMVKAMNRENLVAVNAVINAEKEIAMAIDAISERMLKGGRLYYIGCGTSGRLGVLDASECPPTFGVPKDRVIGIIAGGQNALTNATEFVEDNYEQGKNDVAKYEITENDAIVGISVAGGAKYVIGGVEYAKSKGAVAICLTCNENSLLSKACDISIVTRTGAEVITGSTRLKGGTAHKLVLNALTTCAMVRCGHVYENLMINLRPSNVKLERRMVSIVKDITGDSEEVALEKLKKSNWVIKEAIKL